MPVNKRGANMDLISQFAWVLIMDDGEQRRVQVEYLGENEMVHYSYKEDHRLIRGAVDIDDVLAISEAAPSASHIERVARALCEYNGLNPDDDYLAHNGDFMSPRPDGLQWQRWIEDAVVAIQA